MIRFTGLLVAGAAVACALLCAPVATAAGREKAPALRLAQVEAELDAQREARDRQADAFEAAVSQIELVNATLVAFLALAGIFTALMATRWVRDFTEKLMKDRVDQAIQKVGREVFAANSDALTTEYEAKFAQLYQRYEELVERQK